MESYIRRHAAREPKPSDKRLDFTTYHGLVMDVARSLGIDIGRKETIPTLRLMELDEDLPPYDETQAANAPYLNKKATPLYLDPGDNKWKPDSTQQKVNVSNPFKGITFPKKQRFIFLYLAQCAKFIPFGSGVGGGNWIEFTPTQTFSTSDDAFSAMIDAIHGDIPDEVGTVVTINNTKQAFSGDDQTRGVCANYDSENEVYSCIQLGCPPATP